tara:strand:- start:910 stop:1506 length:597 start_codon:yes stop_codon:yes gene_type:complete
MTGLKKFLKDFKFKDLKNEHVLGIVGLVFLVFALYKYSENKNIFQLGMTSGPVNLGSSSTTAPPANGGGVQGSSQANTYAPYNGASNSAVATSADSSSALNNNVGNKPIANPSDLLPADSNSAWATLNPLASSDLQQVNLLNPTQMVGINTQGTSLRNANLQIRSEPPNPRMNTNCPWNVSTIEGDKFRKQLEIGSSA